MKCFSKTSFLAERNFCDFSNKVSSLLIPRNASDISHKVKLKEAKCIPSYPVTNPTGLHQGSILGPKIIRKHTYLTFTSALVTDSSFI